MLATWVKTLYSWAIWDFLFNGSMVQWFSMVPWFDGHRDCSAVQSAVCLSKCLAAAPVFPLGATRHFVLLSCKICAEIVVYRMLAVLKVTNILTTCGVVIFRVKVFDSEDDYYISHCQQQKPYSGLRSFRRSYSTNMKWLLGSNLHRHKVPPFFWWCPTKILFCPTKMMSLVHRTYVLSRETKFFQPCLIHWCLVHYWKDRK